jgi:cellulose 1,4-beta-cellobiosidase
MQPLKLRRVRKSWLITLLAVLGVPGPASAQTHVDNPFVGATMYVDADFTAAAETTAAATTDPTLAANMRTMGRQPTAVWMDRIAAIAGSATSRGLAAHLDAALAQQQGSTPVVPLFVVYDMPGRDCAALASNGELPLTAAGLATYEAQYIDPIAAILSQPRYAGLRIALVVEPDSLPNLVTNLSVSACAQAQSSGIYLAAAAYAINKLHAIPNVYVYLDMAHSGWLGWPNNSSGFVSLMGTLASSLSAGKNAIDGFVDDTANTLPLREPFMTATQTVNGQQVMNATFYSSDPDIDEQSYAADMYSRFVAAGWPTSIGVLMDTSRNGWGGAARPAAASTSTDLNTFVSGSKVDRRAHRGLWCNPVGAGIGERPAAAPAGYPSAHLDAFVWVKPPGQSDGASTDIPNTEGKKFDRMCDPTYTTQYGVLTGAMPNAPLAGGWFPAQFTALVQNAYPPIGAAPTCSIAPAAPSGLTAAAASSSQINLAWGAVTPPAGCAVTYSVYRSTTGGFTPSAATLVTSGLTSASYASAGLTGGTTYFFVVQAVDGAGSASSAQASAATPNGTSYTLTAAKAGTGTGTITSSPAGVSCGATCSASFASGTAVTLTAVPASGSTFTGWSGACVGTGTCTVTMTSAQSVTATFTGGTPPQGPVATYGRLRVCGTHICSASGEQVQLKGMSWFWSNTGWGAERFYNASAVANLSSTWGATVVRAAIGAEGLGGYLESSTAAAANLARAQALIDAAVAAGVYVIVDWHYSSNAVYQSQAQAFFQQLATNYAGVPNIIWEPFNEPTTNSWASLKTYHQAIIATIRAAGSQNLVVAGTPTWSQDVDVAAADPITTDANVAYTLHFYAGSHGSWLRTKGDTAMSRGAALFVTEWGTVDASGDGGFNAAESQSWTTWLDANKISSANWSLNDKAESASALVSGGGASATGPWPDAQLTQSGLWAKAYISKVTQPTTFTLTVARAGTGGGTVTSSPAGISCGATCSAAFNAGTSVSLTATPATGATFAGWSGACSGTGACAVPMTAAQSVTATFNASPGSFTLTVVKAGTGTGTVSSSPAGISCGATCSAAFTSGTSVTLTAAPASGSTFAGWTGPCSGTGACTVGLTAAQTVTATYTLVGTGTCHVVWAKTNEWPGGFQVGLTLQNTSSTAWTAWTLGWTFPGNQQISSLWNGTATQSGQAVTVKSLSYNGAVPAGGSYNGAGFTGSFSGTNAAPTSFTVNGVTCN